MRNFQDTFETRRRSSISAFSICMILPLISYTFFTTEGISSLSFCIQYACISGRAIFNSVYLWDTNFNCKIVNKIKE